MTDSSGAQLWDCRVARSPGENDGMPGRQLPYTEYRQRLSRPLEMIVRRSKSPICFCFLANFGGPGCFEHEEQVCPRRQWTGAMGK